MTAAGETSGGAVFDRALAARLLGGREDLLRELAGLFLRRREGLVEALRQAVARGDAVEVERRAHALRGAVGQLGATAAHRLLGDLEGLGRQGDLAGAQAAMAGLLEALEALEAALGEFRSEGEG